jgi:hypothetical protein
LPAVAIFSEFPLAKGNERKKVAPAIRSDLDFCMMINKMNFAEMAMG